MIRALYHCTKRLSRLISYLHLKDTRHYYQTYENLIIFKAIVSKIIADVDIEYLSILKLEKEASFFEATHA